jgi:uncharacterized phiE125 gp8 family phage protein
MAMELLSGPTVEPIEIGEAKLFLRIDSDVENSLIKSLIETSRAHVEAALGMALIRQTWRMSVALRTLNNRINLPIWPIQTVGAAKIKTDTAVEVTVPPAALELDKAVRPHRIWIANSLSEVVHDPTARLEVDLVAGYGAAAVDVPAPIRHAMLLLVSHWYETREPALVGHQATKIPHTISELLQPYAEVRV